jgi:hypothetical protein
MNNSGQDRTTVYLIIALVCLYFLLDDFIGKARITNMVAGWFSGVGPIATPGTATAETKPATATQPATVAGPSPVPSPLIPIPGKATKPAAAPKPKTAGDRSWLPDFSLPSSIPSFHIPSPPAWLGGIPALLPEIGAGALLAL